MENNHKNVAISGYYGFENFGDEAILKVLTEELKNCGHNVTVFSKRPDITSAKRGVNSVYTFSLGKVIKTLKNADVLISGGGSLLWGFDKLIAERTGIPTVVVDDPLSCAAYGAGRRLLRIDEMQEGMLNIARRRQLRES